MSSVRTPAGSPGRRKGNRTEEKENITPFVALFRGRTDAFGLMQKGVPFSVRRPLSLFHYRLHLAGKIRLGIYPLLPDGRIHFIVFDFDGPESLLSARAVADRARHFALPLVWEISKSGEWHLWLFFKEPVAACDARRVAQMLLEEAGVKTEVFPKQDRVPEDGLGNFIWLPLSGSSVSKGRTVFVDHATGQPYDDQWQILKRIPKISAERLGQLVEINGLEEASDWSDSVWKPENKVYSGDLLPCAIKMFEGVREGCRDVVAFRLAIHLKSRGYCIEQTERFLQEWNEKNQPPLPSREVTMKVRSAYLLGYRGYGCEDPLIIPFCDKACPIKQKILTAEFTSEGGR